MTANAKPPIRHDLLQQVVNMIDAYQMRPKGYDYYEVRKRKIFESLTEALLYVFNNTVAGDVAEFGTASGFSSLVIARAMGIYSREYAPYFVRENFSSNKTLHLFDSFQGLPEPTDQIDLDSPYVRSRRWKKGTFTGLTKDELQALLSPAYENLKLIEGWYSDTLKDISSEIKFSLLHIDTDIYSSTIEVLDHLFLHDHVSDGCMIVFDDWNCNRASPKFGQRRAWNEVTEKFKIEFSDMGDHAIIGRKFIVHR